MNRFTQADTRLFYWISSYTNKRNAKIIVLLSKTGDGYLYLLLGCSLWIFESQHSSVFIYTALMSYTLEIPLYLILKNLFKRARPCDVLLNFSAHIVPSDKFSLPSGHTAAAFLMATIISTYYPSFLTLVFAWAALIGLSRVLLGVHYPTDVLLGAVLGISIGASSCALFA